MYLSISCKISLSLMKRYISNNDCKFLLFPLKIFRTLLFFLKIRQRLLIKNYFNQTYVWLTELSSQKVIRLPLGSAIGQPPGNMCLDSVLHPSSFYLLATRKELSSWQTGWIINIQVPSFEAYRVSTKQYKIIQLRLEKLCT